MWLQIALFYVMSLGMSPDSSWYTLLRARGVVFWGDWCRLPWVVKLSYRAFKVQVLASSCSCISHDCNFEPKSPWMMMFIQISTTLLWMGFVGTESFSASVTCVSIWVRVKGVWDLCKLEKSSDFWLQKGSWLDLILCVTSAVMYCVWI